MGRSPRGTSFEKGGSGEVKEKKSHCRKKDNINLKTTVQKTTAAGNEPVCGEKGRNRSSSIRAA